MVVTSTDVGGGTNAYLETTTGNLTGAGSVTGTNVALKSAGTVGSSAATRLNTSAGTPAAKGTSVFGDGAAGGGLDNVNTVTNRATATHDKKAGGPKRVDGPEPGTGRTAHT